MILNYIRFANGLSFLTTLILFSAGCLAAPPSWIVDKEKSVLTFETRQDNNIIKGKFTDFTPVIQFDKKDLAHSKIKVTIDTKSAVTGQRLIDTPLLSKDWLDVDAFPKAVFESTSIKALDPMNDGTENYEATGKLTILGVSKDIVLPFTLKAQEGNTHAEGFLQIQRLDYNVGKAIDPSEKLVTNNVAIHIQLLAKPTKTK